MGTRGKHRVVLRQGSQHPLLLTLVVTTCSYLEDRRPASNIDPYIVTALVFDTCCLKGDTTLFDNRAAKLLE